MEKQAGKTGNVFCNIAAKWVEYRFCAFLMPTCLATNQVVAGCKKLLQKIERKSTFCFCFCPTFYHCRVSSTCTCMNINLSSRSQLGFELNWKKNLKRYNRVSASVFITVEPLSWYSTVINFSNKTILL